MQTLNTHAWAMIREAAPADTDPNWLLTNNVTGFRTGGGRFKIQHEPGPLTGILRIGVVFYDEGTPDPLVDPATTVQHPNNLAVSLRLIHEAPRIRTASTTILQDILTQVDVVNLNANTAGHLLTTTLAGYSIDQTLGVRIVSVANAPVAAKMGIVARVE